MQSLHETLRLFPRNSRRPIGLVIVALLLLAAGCKSGYQSGASQSKPGDNKGPRQVKTARVEEMPFGETVTANGTLAAYDQSTASAKVAGRLSAISVDLGSVVRRGQMVRRQLSTHCWTICATPRAGANLPGRRVVYADGLVHADALAQFPPKKPRARVCKKISLSTSVLVPAIEVQTTRT
jgi:hypothetical protein